MTDPKLVITTKAYDARGNLKSVSTPCPSCSAPGTQTRLYNHADAAHPGDVTSMVDPASHTWIYTYDSYGDRGSTTDPLGHQTTSTYNADGWLLSTVSAKGNVSGCGCASTYQTTYGYTVPGTSTIDEFGDVQTITDPLGHLTTHGYDADRNLTSTRDPNGNLTTYVYDLANEQTKVVRPGSPSTTLITDYNLDGTILDQKDGKGHAIQTYGYDGLARVTTVTDALGHATTYSYDPAGNKLTRQDPGGACAALPATGCTSYGYDADNELTAISHSDGTTPNVTGITYDRDGQRTGMADGTGTWSWTWDPLHRLASVTEGRNGTVKYSYDLRNLVTSITHPNGHTVVDGYDNAGRWTSIKDWLANTTTFAYDPNNNLVTETLPTASGVVDSFGYNTADQLAVINDKKGATTLLTAAYGRDRNGQLTSDTSVPSPVHTYRYTPINQLCYAGSTNTTACAAPPTGSQAYSYDTADNLVDNQGVTRSFNAADELCWTISGTSTNGCSTPPTGASSYTYDTRGNLDTITPATGSATTFGYDQANRLVSYTQGSTTAGYTYNGDGLRMSKTVNSTTTNFAWDLAGALPLLLTDGSADYIYGPGGLPLEQVTASTAIWLHHDQLGSTRLLTDSTGHELATYTYNPYGSLSISTGTASTPFQFAGQYTDNESGLYYLRARYYDPKRAEFLTQDPEAALTRSPYGYASGSPVNVADPTGASPLSGWAGSISAECAGASSTSAGTAAWQPPRPKWERWPMFGDDLSGGTPGSFSPPSAPGPTPTIGGAGPDLGSTYIQGTGYPLIGPTSSTGPSYGNSYSITGLLGAFASGAEAGELVGPRVGCVAGGTLGSIGGPVGAGATCATGAATGAVAGPVVGAGAGVLRWIFAGD